MTPVPLAIHEASHAVAGICVGWSGFLEKVSIVSNEHRKGGCHWRDRDKRVKSGDEDVAVGFAGPIGQIHHAPDSLGADLPLFEVSINQPDEVVNRAGVAGWYGSNGWDGDLGPYFARAWFTRTLLPGGKLEFPYVATLEQIEARTHELLRRGTVAAAIHALALRLVAEQEVSGVDAEAIIKTHLTPADYITGDYFTKPRMRLTGTKPH